MTLSRPEKTEDLEPPFRRIGEAGWETGLRDLLRDYGVDEVEPIPRLEIARKEAELGFKLDGSLVEFLQTFGALDFRSMRVLRLDEIGPLSEIWFASHLSRKDRARLPGLVAVLDYLGTGGFVAWDRNEGVFSLVRHDPVGIHPWLPTFDDCIREQCVGLAAGYYGWPDEEVEHLVDEAKRELFES